MPRKNKTIKHTPFRPSTPAAKKTRYATKREAENAAEYQMLLRPGLELYVYKEIDGGWYLTRKQNV